MALLRWSETDPTAQADVASRGEIERHLRSIAREAVAPLIVTVTGLGSFEILVALSPSVGAIVVQSNQDSPDSLRTEWISVGNPERQGHMAFWLLGQHHTEIELRHLLPIETTVSTAGEFLETLTLSRSVMWEENAF
jgi:hypothetical protein